jgi:hypothetical protein
MIVYRGKTSSIYEHYSGEYMKIRRIVDKNKDLHRMHTSGIVRVEEAA